MAKFKLGKVRVRKDLNLGTIYYSEGEKDNDGLGCGISIAMKKLHGQVVTIERVEEYGKGARYFIEEDGKRYSWSDEMFVPVKEKTQQEVVDLSGTLGRYSIYTEKVIYNGTTTILFYRNEKYDKNLKPTGKSQLKKVVVKCLEGDEYNKDKGLAIAITKAVHKETGKLLKKM